MCGRAPLAAAPARQRWSVEQLEAMRVCSRATPRTRRLGRAHLAAWRGIAQRLEVGLAHTRLSILDVSHGSDQPMCDAESSVAFSLNGESYN